MRVVKPTPCGANLFTFHLRDEENFCSMFSNKNELFNELHRTVTMKIFYKNSETPVPGPHFDERKSLVFGDILRSTVKLHLSKRAERQESCILAVYLLKADDVINIKRGRSKK